ncbi:hypothetical protein MTR_6g471190 [Medicago truncatula]|uniref:Uncharacterized protein n=1 Tax=Medicago truncatula TaxID=3880 RepID=A0A072UAM4_MEDTR|nr:hypothetical protein MTR_6g471190 [Medicago truncatula]
MDRLEQEVHELRGEVTTLRAEVEKLTSLVSSLMATKDPPLVQQRPQPLCQPICMERPRQQDLLPNLLKKNLVQTLPPPRVPNPLPPWYRPDLNCVFHQGAPGHDTEQSYLLKEDQKLIDNNAWSFDDLDIKVLLQQQHLASHSIAAVMPIFDPIPMKYAVLFPDLLRRKLVQTRPPPRIPKKLPAGYRPDLSCVFHQGAPGHDIERCFAFRNEVQKLIQDKALPFQV